MSFTVTTHILPSQLKRYARDHYWNGGANHLSSLDEAVDELYVKFSLKMSNPFNIALSEVMVKVAQGMGEGTDSSQFAEDIFDEVEEIFDEADIKIEATDIPYHFYLLCPLLYHYLIDEEQVEEFHDWKLAMANINHNRIDLTFRD